jgi:hypothetical protein
MRMKKLLMSGWINAGAAARERADDALERKPISRAPHAGARRERARQVGDRLSA